MTQIPLGTSDWRRDVALAPDIQLLNRYFERTPDPEHGPVSLLARPALKRMVHSIGIGPIRGVYSQPGSFDDDLFAVSGDTLFGIDGTGAATNLGTVSSNAGQASMAATGQLGDTPAYLFIADGGTLYVYTDNGHALGQLQAGGSIANGDEVEIGGIYYEWTNGSVDTGSPDGSSGTPWLVDLGATNAEALDNLFNAINETGTEGTTYSTGLIAHEDVLATTVTASDLFVLAQLPGTDGNAITTTETGVNLAWGGGTLSGGGASQLRAVPMPDDVGAVSVGYISGYVIVVCAQGDGVNGRFYWIDPGQITIDPLDFATAERAPDPAWSVRVVGDQFWILGQSSVEPWYLTGQGTAPFARQQARVFDRGVWEGSDAQVKDSVVIVDSLDGAVYAITGGGPQRISDSSIEERIRKAMAIQTQQGQ